MQKQDYTVIRLGAREFRPALIPTLATFAMLPLLLWLGYWQLDRAAQKRELLSRYASGGEYVLDLNTAGAELRGELFQQVTVTGAFDSDRQVLLDGMVRDRLSGYHVLTPLRLADGRGWIMVNRGWVAPGASRAQLPAVDVGGQSRTVQGRLSTFPQAGMRLGDNPTDASAPWPRVMLYPTPQEVQALFDQPVLPRVVLLAPEDKDGYVRDWTPATIAPERHLAYAAQWFAFAATLFSIFLILNFRKIESESDE